ncbi:serine/threonine-protein kinase [Gordonia terrae]|uniref:non-specific serine/threonine protein kinase n=2 Tax=Gordonia terrae TaxID=2055 RepID=A0AAD0K5X3_9ACTN|nr:serine/threonine-protein kinase [Gordonia terrae]ANY22922.1 serine/threonine protein kinase [Gordonia terrae]AWO83654.1 serine/threonine protein kinase [Gordonia terrae]VTR07408.1 serine/threonine protein kinase [Clostridioides difficile]VTS44699.1 Serine/threonine-protein kinase PrkC [Gordonia terrae]
MSTTAGPHHAPGPQYLVAGRYRLKSRIGGGGMGTVWLARDQLLDRDVAVKQVVSTEGLTEDSADNVRQRAMREGRIAAKLSHRNAIAMHDVALDRGEPWLVMEYLPSRSVAQILHATKTLAPAEAAQIGAQVADAMVEAHAAGIVHRDIKPGNILIAEGGRHTGLVKITDFGISRAKDDVTLTQTGVITGTPAYFAPEVARGADPQEASDVYSLGATIYTMVEGQPPFGVDDNSIALLHKVARARINPMQNAAELEPVLLRLLEPSPTKRPTMSQARDLLTSFAAGSRGTRDQVLTGLITRPGAGTPVWSQRTNRSSTTGPHRPAGATLPPYAPTMSADRGSRDLPRTRQGMSPTMMSTPQPHSSTPRPPTAQHHPSDGRQPSYGPPAQPSGTSSTALAVSIFVFFAVLAVVVVLAIALVR